jgi:hypothetical protein
MYPDVLLFIDGAWTSASAGARCPSSIRRAVMSLAQWRTPNGPTWIVHWRPPIAV